jgi:hypothetical protein
VTFLTGGDKGAGSFRVARSTDGATWTGGTGLVTTANVVLSMASNGSAFVYIANDDSTGYVVGAHTNDAISWTNTTTSLRAALGNTYSGGFVRYLSGPNLYVASTSGIGYLATSANGTTWTGHSQNGTIAPVYGVACNASGFTMYVGYGIADMYTASSPGGTLTGATVISSLYAGTVVPVDVAYSPTLNRWVCVCADYTNARAKAAYSDNDGASWSDAPTMTTLASTYTITAPNRVIWSSRLSMFIAGTDKGILLSTDGITWVYDTNFESVWIALGYGTVAAVRDLVENGTKLLAVIPSVPNQMTSP